MKGKDWHGLMWVIFDGQENPPSARAERMRASNYPMRAAENVNLGLNAKWMDVARNHRQVWDVGVTMALGGERNGGG